MPYHKVAAEVRDKINVDEGISVLLKGQKVPGISAEIDDMHSCYDQELIRRKAEYEKKGKTNKLARLPWTKVPMVLKEFNLVKRILI